MSNAYHVSRERYEMVLSMLKEQLDEYEQVKNGIEDLKSIENPHEEIVDCLNSMKRVKTRLSKGIRFNCGTIAMIEGIDDTI